MTGPTRLQVSVVGWVVSSVFSDVRQLFSDVAVNCVTTQKSEDPRSDNNYSDTSANE